MTSHQYRDAHQARHLDRPNFVRKLRVIGLSLTSAFGVAAALAPVAQAGVEAQHNETLVVV
jgi:hypothetical protein